MSSRQPSPVGELLRQWRRLRGMTQRELAEYSGVSSRHLSFVETGRSAASQELVERLGGVLDVPLRDRNILLQAAGFGAVYGASDLDSPERSTARAVLDALLRHHEPFPAVIIDAQWYLRMMNKAATKLVEAFLDPMALLAHGPPTIREMFFGPDGFRPYLRNWPDLGPALLHRLYRAMLASDPEGRLRDLYDSILALEGIPEDWRKPRVEIAAEPVIYFELAKGDLELNLIAMITTVGTPVDITLQEVRMESFIPADDASEALLRSLSAEG